MVWFAVTGQPLRCDVIVDEIVKVEIETTTKELFLDDSPEEFVLRAVNDKGIFVTFLLCVLIMTSFRQFLFLSKYMPSDRALCLLDTWMDHM